MQVWYVKYPNGIIEKKLNAKINPLTRRDIESVSLAVGQVVLFFFRPKEQPPQHSSEKFTQLRFFQKFDLNHLRLSPEMTITRNSIIVYYSNSILNAILLKRQQLLGAII